MEPTDEQTLVLRAIMRSRPILRVLILDYLSRSWKPRPVVGNRVALPCDQMQHSAMRLARQAAECCFSQAYTRLGTHQLASFTGLSS